MVVADLTLGFESGDDRAVQRFGQRNHFAHAVARAIAGNDQRTLRADDAGEGVADRYRGRRDGGGSQAAVGPARPLGAGVEHLHFVGQDEMSDVTLDDGVLDRQRRQFGVVAFGQHGLAETGDRLEGRFEVDVLERARSEHLGLDLSGQCDHRGAIDLGVPQPGQKIGGPRSGNRQTGRRPSRCLGVAGAGEGGRAFMSDAKISELAALGLDPQRLGHAEIGMADHAEHGIDPPGDQGFGNHMADRPLRMFGFRQSDFDPAVLFPNLQRPRGHVIAVSAAGSEVEIVAVPRAAQRALAHCTLAEGTALMGALTIERECFAVMANQRDGFFANGQRAYLALGEVIGAADRHPGFLGRFGGSCGRRDGARLVVVKTGIPVAAVAKRFVARLAAAAQGVVFGARTAAELDALQFDRPADIVRTIVGDLDLRVLVKAGLSLVVLDVAQRARRAGADDADNVLTVFGVGIDPRLDAQPPDRRQPVAAEAGVRAHTTVVEDGDIAALVAVQPVGNALVGLVVGEADPIVGAVAKRLVTGAAATAQDEALFGGNPVAPRVDDAGHIIGPDRDVLDQFKRRFGADGIVHLLLALPLLWSGLLVAPERASARSEP